MTMYAGLAIRSHIQSDTYRNDVNVKMKVEEKTLNRMANGVVACYKI